MVTRLIAKTADSEKIAWERTTRRTREAHINLTIPGNFDDDLFHDELLADLGVFYTLASFTAVV